MCKFYFVVLFRLGYEKKTMFNMYKKCDSIVNSSTRAFVSKMSSQNVIRNICVNNFSYFLEYIWASYFYLNVKLQYKIICNKE